MSAELSDRQVQILQLRAEGYSGPQIARRICIAISTISWHERVIITRLSARNITHAVHIAGMAGIIGDHEDCGDRAAYLRHLRRNEPPCAACRAANARRQAARRAVDTTHRHSREAA